MPVLAARYPRAAGWGLAVTEAMLSGPAEIAVVGPAGPGRDALQQTAMLAAPPGAVVVIGDGTQPPPPAPAEIPLLAGRLAVAGQAAAYVCRNFTCRAPVTEPAQLRSELGPPGPQGSR